MTKKIARRTLLRSALAGGAVLVAGGSAVAATIKSPVGETTVPRARNMTPEMQTLLKYAGEFGGNKHRSLKG